MQTSDGSCAERVYQRKYRGGATYQLLLRSRVLLLCLIQVLLVLFLIRLLRLRDVLLFLGSSGGTGGSHLCGSGSREFGHVCSQLRPLVNYSGWCDVANEKKTVA